MLWTQYLIKWHVSFSFGIVSEPPPFSFIWGLFLCLPIVCGSVPVSLCFLNCSVLTPWVVSVNSCDRIPVRFSGTLLDLPILVILGCGLCWLCVCLWFLILVGSFFGGFSHKVVIWGSVCLPPLVFCCAGVGWFCWSWFFCVYTVLRLSSYSCSVVLSNFSTI